MAAHHGNLAKTQHVVNMLEWANIAVPQRTPNSLIRTVNKNVSY